MAALGLVLGLFKRSAPPTLVRDLAVECMLVEIRSSYPVSKSP